MRTRLALVALASTALLAVASGCGGGGNTAVPKIESFSATPGALPSTGGTVLLTWKVTGAEAVDIEPGVGLVATTAASVAVTTNSTFTLLATNAHGKATAEATVTVGAPVHVSGTLALPLVAGALQGSTVFVIGQPDVAPAVTDSAGHFELDDVVQPYTLAFETIPASFLLEVRGITRTDPFISIPFAPAIPIPPQISKTAAVTGSALGITFPLGSGQEIAQTLEADGTAQPANPGSSSAFSGNIAWTNRDTIDATLTGLFVDASTPTAPTFKVASQQFSVSDGQNVGPVNLTYESVPTVTATGSFEYPSEYGSSVGTVDLFATTQLTRALGQYPAPPEIPLVGVATNGTYSFHIPSLPAGACYADTFASAPFGVTSYEALLGNGSRTTRLPEVPSYQLPIQGATTTLDGRIALSLDPGLVAVHQFTLGGQTIVVMSADTSFSLDDLGVGELGLAPPTNGAPFGVTWGMTAYGMFPTMDDFVDPVLAPHDRAFVQIVMGRTFQVQP